MLRMFAALLLFAAIVFLPAPAHADASRVHVTADSDARAIEIAQATVAAMGGWEAWDQTRYLTWRFFDRRDHWWDRETGDIRIQSDDTLILMNLNTEKGRVWKSGTEITEPDSLAKLLDTGRQIWVNDSYWLIMPFKLLDPGVTLKYLGERALADGRNADVLQLTFGEGIGYTPQNRYEVFVAKDTGLVEQWSFYADAKDAEPGFTMPWAGWTQFGGVKIATDHGRGDPWPVDAPASLPPEVFTDPARIER